MNKKTIRVLLVLLATVLCIGILAACNNPPEGLRDDPYADQSAGFTVVHTVTFDLNGGTGNLKTRKIGDGQGIGQFDVPTKDGKLFLGWTTEKDDKDSLINYNYAITADVTLYAFWGDADTDNVMKSAALATGATYTAVKSTLDTNGEDLMGSGSFVINLNNSKVESGYLDDDGDTVWLSGGIFYFADSDSENYKYNAPKDRSGSIAGYIAENKARVDSLLAGISSLTEFVYEGNDKYTYVTSIYLYEFYISNGKLVKLVLGGNNVEFKFDGSYDLPAVASNEYEQRYNLTIVKPDGDRVFIEGVLNVAQNELNSLAKADFGYQIEGIYKDAGFTADQKVTLAEDGLALTADTALYVKYVETEGAMGIVLRAYGASIKKTDYIISRSIDQDLSISVRKKGILSEYYKKDTTTETWSDGKKLWEKTADENTVKNTTTGGNSLSGSIYHIEVSNGFALKDGTTNVYVGNYSSYTLEVTVDNGLVTAVKHNISSSISVYAMKYDNLTDTGIPARPQDGWVIYHKLTANLAIDGTYTNGSTAYFKTITEDDVKNIAEARGYAGWTFNYYTDRKFTVAATFPINEDKIVYIKPTDQTYTFVTNGGSEVANIVGVSVKTAPETIKTGKYFAGWYDNAELTGSIVSFPYTNKDTKTLYAAWSDSRNGKSFGAAYLATSGQYTSNAGNKDTYFVITPTTTGTYTFYSERNTAFSDTYGYLYNSELNQIASNDDGNENAQFKITYKLEAGKTYYLKASYYSSGANFAAYDVFITVA
jgi:fructose-specific phosphotransferase system component IIB